MTRSACRIDQAARRLLTAIAATREAQVLAMALEHYGGTGARLIQAGLLRRHGSTIVGIADDGLDDSLVTIGSHPITGRPGHLGNTAWQDDEEASLRQIYALDMQLLGRRVVAGLDCSLAGDPVPYLDGTVLDFGMARLPRRRSQVGIWLARGLSDTRRDGAFRDLAGRRPSPGLRLVIALDPNDHSAPAFLRGHDFVALGDVVDHEDGLAVDPEILSARLLKGPDHKGPVWVSGDGGVLIVHGRQHEFTGTKQKIAVTMLAEAWLNGDPVLPVARIIEEAECGRSVKRLKDLFGGHATWHDVIHESGSNCWLEI
ncbi:hypothetical protein [Roseospira visakhapatnamensis]|uniref:Uncharacterized protein n=1 Tax=Roseospira visakhapatnamensis TaxID=390880 RepID=A0A7W6RFI9_9PROT|nr:hypothetical protein [Roseospira visakhapatnamensis]MBB4267624.1 hypothetical protein [Roseospira visakhapatnamensis]